MRSMSVVLPAPLGPMTPTKSPWATPKDSSSTAFRPPKAFDRLRTSSMVGLGQASGLATDEGVADLWRLAQLLRVSSMDDASRRHHIPPLRDTQGGFSVLLDKKDCDVSSR